MATQILYNGWLPEIASGTYVFAIQGHTDGITGNPQAVVLRPPYTGTIKNFRVRINNAPGAGNTRTFTVWKGLTDTGINVVFGAADSGTKEDLTNTSSALKTSSLFIKETHTGSPNITGLQHSLMMEGDVSGETALMGGVGTALDLSTVYLSFAGHDASSPAGETTERFTEIVIPTPGTLKGFVVVLQNPPGGGVNSRTFTIRHNGVDSSLSVTLLDIQFLKIDSGSFTVAKGDTISVKHTATNTPTSSQASVAVIFVPDIVGEFIIPTARSTAFNTSSIRYHSVTAHERLTSSILSGGQQLSGDAFKLVNIAVNLDTAPGAGNRYWFWFLEGSFAAGNPLLISDAATSGTLDLNADVAAAILATTKVAPQSSPAASRGTICYTGFIEEPAAAAEVSAMMMGANF